MSLEGWLVINQNNSAKGLLDSVELLTGAFESRNVTLRTLKNNEILYNFDQSGDALLSNTPSDKRPKFALAWDKDIMLFRQLELSGIRVFNSADSIRYCDDKFLTYQVLANKGMPFPKTIQHPFTYNADPVLTKKFVDKVVKIIGLPMILKENFGSLGEQVHFAKDLETLLSLTETLGSRAFLYQEYCEKSHGFDTRICVVGGKVQIAVQRSSECNFKVDLSKIQQIEPTQKEEDLALKCCDILELDFGAVDFLKGNDNSPLICEVNSSPFLNNLNKAIGFDLSNSIADHVLAKITT